jgi:hypothetical protein
VNRQQTLERAAECVLRDRAATHGGVEDTFGLIAGLWSAYLDRPMSGHDVAALLALLKIARLRGNPGHEDNWVDLAGYAACGAELAT